MPSAVRNHEMPPMPLKLKALIAHHRITQPQLGAAVIQANGAPMEKTGINLLLNWGEWPRLTARESIEQQITAFLRAQGVAEADIATAFELDEGGVVARAGNGPRTFRLARVHTSPKPPKPETDIDPLLLEPTMLSQAAKRHFKITFDPFRLEPQSSADVFMGEEQRFVTAALTEAIANTRMVALVGESGSGKSTLWSWITDKLATEGQPVHIIYPQFTQKEKLTGTGIMQAIVRDIDSSAAPRRSSEMLARQAHELLAARVADGQRVVLVFEEGHDLSTMALKQLKRFHEFKLGAWKRLMSIILLAQPELLTKLNRAGGEAREVANRLEVIRMLPLENDLEAYVSHRLGQGGIPRERIFAPDALDAVRRLLTGTRDGQAIPMSYPLLVGNLLTLAMNKAAEVGAPLVDAAIVADAKRRGA